MDSTMSGTAQIMTEYPEVGKLYSVRPWHIVHQVGFILPGRTETDYEWKLHGLRIAVHPHPRVTSDPPGTDNPNIVLSIKHD
jgi:hypothetical protein